MATVEAQLDDMASELRALRADNEWLRTRLDEMEGDIARGSTATAPGSASPPTPRPARGSDGSLSRRGLLRRTGTVVAAAAGAAAIGSLARPTPAAAGGSLVLNSVSNDANGPTGLSVFQGPADGVYGFGVTDHGLDRLPLSASVFGHDSGTYGIAVAGISSALDGTGVVGLGSGDKGLGVVGDGTRIGVYGTSSKYGVWGESISGRGAYFRGEKAQIRLHANASATHPTGGAKGDLYLDASARLWLCKGGTNWHLLG